MSDQVTHAIAGAGGGALSAIVTYPLITLSTRAQTTAKAGHVSNLEAIKSILKEEGGVKKLYAGLESALWGMTLTNFVYYYFYEGIKTVYTDGSGGVGMTAVQSMITGAYSGAATAIVTNPIWVVNTRMMVKDGKSTLQVIKDIVEKEGLGTFFSGVGPALLLVINPVLNYTIFEQLKQAIERKNGRMSSAYAFLIGAFGKIVATTVTYPLITIKARLQAGNSESKIAGEDKTAADRKAAADQKAAADASRKQTLLKRLLQIWHTLSFSDLYRGWSLKVLQSALQSAFLFLFKEQLFDLAVLLMALAKRRPLGSAI